MGHVRITGRPRHIEAEMIEPIEPIEPAATSSSRKDAHGVANRQAGFDGHQHR